MLAVGVLISGALQFAYQAMMLRRCELHFRLVWDLAHPGLRQIVQLTLPVALGVGVIQVNTFVDQLFAQFCVPGEGANTVLRFGNVLMQFPLGVLGIALATAVLPALAHHEAVGDRKSFVGAVGLSLRTVVLRFASLRRRHRRAQRADRAGALRRPAVYGRFHGADGGGLPLFHRSACGRSAACRCWRARSTRSRTCARPGGSP